MNLKCKRDFAGSGEAAEIAALGTVKERKTFLTPIPGNEEFQFFTHGLVWVSPPPLWSMESSVAVQARQSLTALVERVEQREFGYQSIRWFLRRVADEDSDFVPAQRSLDKMSPHTRDDVLRVCALLKHMPIHPITDLETNLAYRLLDAVALVHRKKTARILELNK